MDVGLIKSDASYLHNVHEGPVIDIRWKSLKENESQKVTKIQVWVKNKIHRRLI